MKIYYDKKKGLCIEREGKERAAEEYDEDVARRRRTAMNILGIGMIIEGILFLLSLLS